MARPKPIDLDYSRLATAHQRSLRVLEPARKTRLDGIGLYAGYNYGNNDGVPVDPVNLIQFMVKTLVRSLINRNPKVMLSTFSQQAKPAIASMEWELNDKMQKMYFARTGQRIMRDAMFGQACGKVALASAADAASRSFNLDAGQPFYERVSLDDMAWDSDARSPEELSWAGNQFRVPLSAIKDDKRYNKDARDRLTASPARFYNSTGDERAAAVGRGMVGSGEEFEDHVDLWEIILYRYGTVVTFSADDLTGGIGNLDEPLLEQKWIGPPCGPYHFFGFDEVPDNVLALAPVPGMIPLHAGENNVVRKLIEQGRRQKETWAVAAGADAEATRMGDTDDGGFFRCDDPQKIKQVLQGGPSQANFQLHLELFKRFTALGGSLETLAGTAPQADTLGQEKILNVSSSRMSADMQDAAVTHFKDAARAILWYLKNHPTNVTQAHYPVPGLPGMSVPMDPVTPEMRQQFSYGDIDVRLDLSTLTNKTPSDRAQFLQQMLAMLTPYAPQMQAQGMGVNMQFFVRKMAEYADEPDLIEMVQAQPIPEQGGDEGGSSGPTESTYNYARQSTAGSAADQDMETMNAASSQDGGWNAPIGG